MSASGIPEPGETTFRAFLDALSARTPTPAGGAAAGLSAAFGAALLAMCARFSTGERFAEIESEMAALAAECGELERRALELVRVDQDAFGAVAAAYGLPRASAAEQTARSAAIQAALVGATEPPVQLGEVCARLAEIGGALAGKGNPGVVSDVATGVACIASALEGTLVNVEANRAAIKDEATRARLAEVVSCFGGRRDALRSLLERIRGGLRGA